MHQFRSKVYLGIALLNVAGTLWLAPRFGIIGAAIPTGVAYLIGHGFIMNWYYWKKVGLGIPKFWKSLSPLFLVGALLCSATLFISKWVIFYNWTSLFIGIGCYTAVYAALLWLFILSESEKAAIKQTVLRKILHK